MHPIPYAPRNPVARVLCGAAAAVASALLVVTQFGIADGYTTEADARLAAAARARAVAAQASAPAAADHAQLSTIATQVAAAKKAT